jgi:cytochrome P450
MINMLMRYPRVYKKLTDEIRSTFKSEEEIRLVRTMEELPYLSACIEENLRIFPPAPIGFLRSVNNGGDVIDGHAIPGGVCYPPPEYNLSKLTLRQTSVSVSTWASSHSEANFKECDKFIPERWLDDPAFASDIKLASRPFSMGPRGCIGKE